MSTKQKSESDGAIAIIGERELVMGYRLLGIDDTYIVNQADEALKTMESIFFSRKFNLIIASQFVSASLPHLFRTRVEASIEPLVLFMPSLKGNVQEESIATLAKRVLGISIKMG
ncbi:MAG TPA: V-type ATP synthase subunit F [Nitrososphaeraceae archaeon]|jgi:V/A-type H+-transporting ATPase subunit F|nr:V-type ATP synthase subunit F [Nitrososphaeraceae archaeon]